MKITSVLIIVMFLFSLASINAQDGVTTDAVVEQEAQAIIEEDIISDPVLEDVGTTPDQAGYGLKTALERVRLALTFNREKKAELALRLAELRVKEARLMAAKNKLEALERLGSEHRRYIEVAENSIGGVADASDSAAIERQAKLKIRLKEQKNQIDEFEALILIKARGLTEEQKTRLLALIEEFKQANANIEVKIDVKEETIKTRLKAQGLTDDQIDGRLERLEDQFEEREERIEDKAKHRIDQAEKMYNLANQMIEKAFTVGLGDGTSGNMTFNTTIRNKERTLKIHAKAKVTLDEAKAKYEAKQFFEATNLAQYSKKLSALTIASIHGSLGMSIEARFGDDDIKKGGVRRALSEEERRKIEEQIRLLEEKIKGIRSLEASTSERNRIPLTDEKLKKLREYELERLKLLEEKKALSEMIEEEDEDRSDSNSGQG